VVDCLLPSLSGVESVLLFRRPLEAPNADALFRALSSLRFLVIYGEMPEIDNVLEDPEVCPKLFFTYRRIDATRPRLEPVPNRSIPKEVAAEEFAWVKNFLSQELYRIGRLWREIGDGLV